MVVWLPEVAPTLTADFGDKLGQNNQHIDSQKGGMFVQSFMQPTYAIQGNMIGRNDNAGPQGDGINVEVCFTQNTTDRHAVAQPICLMDQGGSVMNIEHDVTGTLRRETHGHEPVIIQPIALAENTIGRQPENGGNGDGFTVGGPMYTLNATGVHGVEANMAVRRLTPTECERLQGFPDNYTNIPWRKKEESPDGPRYKALGNSMAVPVMQWIGKRIADAP
jgi:site-specific DNA-cytosine methylase